MNAFSRLCGSAALALLLGAGLAGPAMAAKLDGKNPPLPSTTAAPDSDSTAVDFGDDTSEWANDGECDDPRFSGTGSATELVDADVRKDATDCRAAYEAGTVTFNGDTTSSSETATTETTPAPTETPLATAAIDFGDDSSQWAKDGECDDPRFSGEASAQELVDADLGKDATDCKAAYDAGTVTFNGEAGADVAATTPPAPAIDFGDDSSQWAKDGECDDPRFSGTGSAEELEDADIAKDATDCKAAYDAGTVSFVGGDTAPTTDTAADTPATDTTDTPQDGPAIADINYGDDSSEWAKDGECDDPRFSGEGSADEVVDADMLKDATDCQAAYEAGTVTFNGDSGMGMADVTPTADIAYGDDTSQWAKDGECDDPRFSGTGVAAELEAVDNGHDATDCRAAVEAGTATFIGDTGTTTTTAPAAFDYGSDFSKWANDGECDDRRFYGEGTDKKLLLEDEMGDATDCKALEAEGKVAIRKVYTPQYAAGAPYDSAHVDFGDNTSSYANDDRCDDPRFEGPGAAATLLDSDTLHDAEDCKKAYEAGTVLLVSEANGQ